MERMIHVSATIQQRIDVTSEEYTVLSRAGDLRAPDPCYKGRLLLIGDAAHATVP